MAKRYGHIGSVARRQAVDLLAKAAAELPTQTDQVEGGHKNGHSGETLSLSKRRKLLQDWLLRLDSNQQPSG